MKKSEFKRYFSVLLALVMTMSIFGSYSVPTSATDLPSVLSLQYMSARTNDIIVDVTFDRNIATAPDIDVWQVYNATDKVLVNGINPISALTFQYAPGGALNKVRLFIMKSDFYTTTNQTVEFKTTFGCENFTGIQSKIKFASNVVIQNGTDPSSVSFSEVGTIPNILSVQYIAERTNDVYVDLTFDMNVATSTEIEAWEIYNATGKVLVNGASPLSAFTFQYAPGGALNKVRLFIMKSDFASSNRQTLEFKTGFNCANFSSIAYAKKFRSNIVIANGTIANTVSFNSISLLPSILSAQYIGDRADPNYDVLIDFTFDMDVVTPADIDTWDFYDATGKIKVNGLSPASQFVIQYAPGGALNKVRLFIKKSDFNSLSNQTIEIMSGFGFKNITGIAATSVFRSNVVVVDAIEPSTVTLNKAVLTAPTSQYFGRRNANNDYIFDIIFEETVGTTGAYSTVTGSDLIMINGQIPVGATIQWSPLAGPNQMRLFIPNAYVNGNDNNFTFKTGFTTQNGTVFIGDTLVNVKTASVQSISFAGYRPANNDYMVDMLFDKSIPGANGHYLLDYNTNGYVVVNGVGLSSTTIQYGADGSDKKIRFFISASSFDSATPQTIRIYDGFDLSNGMRLKETFDFTSNVVINGVIAPNAVYNAYDYVSFGEFNVSPSKFVSNITDSKRTVDTFIAGITKGPGVVATVLRGSTTITGTEIIGTGVTIILTANSIVKTYTAVILGDIDGSGTININDLALSKQHLLKTNLLSGVSLIAGDVSGNGSVTITDLLAIKKAALGIAVINQSTPIAESFFLIN